MNSNHKYCILASHQLVVVRHLLNAGINLGLYEWTLKMLFELYYLRRKNWQNPDEFYKARAREMSLKLFRRGVGVDGGGGVRYLLIAFSLSCFLSFFSQAVDKLTCVTFLIKMHQGQETHIRKGRVFLSLGEESPHHMKLQWLCHVFLSNAPVWKFITWHKCKTDSPLQQSHELL